MATNSTDPRRDGNVTFFLSKINLRTKISLAQQAELTHLIQCMWLYVTKAKLSLAGRRVSA